jgi:hypothetical protein
MIKPGMNSKSHSTTATPKEVTRKVVHTALQGIMEGVRRHRIDFRDEHDTPTWFNLIYRFNETLEGNRAINPAAPIAGDDTQL